jgi:hypothetical protein
MYHAQVMLDKNLDDPHADILARQLLWCDSVALIQDIKKLSTPQLMLHMSRLQGVQLWWKPSVVESLLQRLFRNRCVESLRDGLEVLSDKDLPFETTDFKLGAVKMQPGSQEPIVSKILADNWLLPSLRATSKVLDSHTVSMNDKRLALSSFTHDMRVVRAFQQRQERWPADDVGSIIVGLIAICSPEPCGEDSCEIKIVGQLELASTEAGTTTMHSVGACIASSPTFLRLKQDMQASLPAELELGPEYRMLLKSLKDGADIKLFDTMKTVTVLASNFREGACENMVKMLMAKLFKEVEAWKGALPAAASDMELMLQWRANATDMLGYMTSAAGMVTDPTLLQRLSKEKEWAMHELQIVDTSLKCAKVMTLITEFDQGSVPEPTDDQIRMIGDAAVACPSGFMDAEHTIKCRTFVEKMVGLALERAVTDSTEGSARTTTSLMEMASRIMETAGLTTTGILGWQKDYVESVQKLGEESQKWEARGENVRSRLDKEGTEEILDSMLRATQKYGLARAKIHTHDWAKTKIDVAELLSAHFQEATEVLMGDIVEEYENAEMKLHEVAGGGPDGSLWAAGLSEDSSIEEVIVAGQRFLLQMEPTTIKDAAAALEKSEAKAKAFETRFVVPIAMRSNKVILALAKTTMFEGKLLALLSWEATPDKKALQIKRAIREIFQSRIPSSSFNQVLWAKAKALNSS